MKRSSRLKKPEGRRKSLVRTTGKDFKGSGKKGIIQEEVEDG